MYYLNLTKDFWPEIDSGEEFDLFTFSGGEPHINIPINPLRKHGAWTITTRINSFNDLGVLAVAVDALKRGVGPPSISLYVPYFPGARQDRVANTGEALTVKVYADMINAMGFDNVFIFDPHSDVTTALINNVVIKNNHEFVAKALEYELQTSRITLISPDAGANKKIYSLAKSLPTEVIIVKCDKTRDVKTGKLSGFEVYADDLYGSKCVIVDDICDGGGTFIGLAEELKKKDAGDLYLIVSHGIFSKGFKELDKVFTRIYTTDSIQDWTSPKDTDRLFKADKLTQIKLEDL